MTYTPYSETDDETSVYRFTGSYMKLPGSRETIERGDEVALPDRAADPIDDLLDPIDGDGGSEDGLDETEDDSGDESGAEAAESDTSDTETQASESSSDAEAADGGDSESGLVDVESYDTPDAFPAEVPDAESWEWDALQEVSKANDVNAAQSKEEQVDDLRAIAGE